MSENTFIMKIRSFRKALRSHYIVALSAGPAPLFFMDTLFKCYSMNKVSCKPIVTVL